MLLQLMFFNGINYGFLRGFANLDLLKTCLENLKEKKLLSDRADRRYIDWLMLFTGLPFYVGSRPTRVMLYGTGGLFPNHCAVPLLLPDTLVDVLHLLGPTKWINESSAMDTPVIPPTNGRGFKRKPSQDKRWKVGGNRGKRRKKKKKEEGREKNNKKRKKQIRRRHGRLKET